MAEAERLLEALDPEQRQVALALDGPVRVLAGAGTGKTRAITHRIAYGVAMGRYVPTETLAVTFTTRAAGELRERLTRLGAHGVQARTFHSAALRMARYFWPQTMDAELPPIVGSKLGLVSEAVADNGLRADQADLRDLAGEIEWAKVSNVTPETYATRAERARREVSGWTSGTIAKIFDAYETAKGNRARIDMEDVLLCGAAIMDDDRVARTVRQQYRTFVVDEFQDVSPLQWRLLRLWLGDRDDVCVVGDPAQTIYSFAGASSAYLERFPQELPGTESITLMRNYRSTPQVIETANTVMRGRGGAVQLRAVRDAGATTTFTGHPDEVAEADAVAAQIKRAVDAGARPSDFAVLFRINAQSENVEEALAAAGVPYVVRGAERFFERGEVRQAVTLLRGAAKAGEGDGGSLPDVVRGVLGGMGWSTQPPEGRGQQRDRWESLQALIDTADEFASERSGAGLADLVAELERRAAAQFAPVAEGVTLTTLHAAKGLEWPTVFCLGMHEGTMPFAYAETPAEIEEERRLFYVGLTRARDELHVSWAAARSPGGRGQRGATRFLDAVLTPEQRNPAAASGAARKRSAKGPKVTHCRVCDKPLTEPADRKLGRCSDCPSSYDEGLFESLREWRREQASEAKLPAYCVFTDATMTAIAEARPTDLRALAKINGIGAAKLDKYGDQIVALCAAEHDDPAGV